MPVQPKEILLMSAALCAVLPGGGVAAAEEGSFRESVAWQLVVAPGVCHVKVAVVPETRLEISWGGRGGRRTRGKRTWLWRSS